MSRSAVPSQVQVMKLLDCLEAKPWLATGHARTSHARNRTKTAWQEIAVTLNADGSGCMKTSQQWAKPSTNDRALEEVNNIMAPDVPSTSRARTPQRVVWSRQDAEDADNVTTGSESILQVYELSLPVELETGAVQTEQSTPSLPDVQADEHRDIRMENEPGIEQLGHASSPPPAVPSRRNASIASSSPRRRRPFMTRRRVIQHSPPSQRQSQMASLTERLIAIEEKRLETERILAENQRAMVNVFQQMAEAWNLQSRALQDLVQKIKRN